MSIAIPEDATGERPSPARQSRARRGRIMHWIRRTHLYLGLFLLPWAVLYGITGYLFNHPAAFNDKPIGEFGKSELAGTPMENVPTPAETAEQVVAALQARANPPADYRVVNPEKARYNRDLAFARVVAEGQVIQVNFDLKGDGGTVHVTPAAKKGTAPFAVGPRGSGGRPNPKAPPALIEGSLQERVRTAVPIILERMGYPPSANDRIAPIIPDLIFHLSDGTKTWQVTYTAQSDSVDGIPADEAPPPEELSTRTFLLRLHAAHGYPSTMNPKWYWAVIVDVMSFVLVFWGVSGIFMWWQIKATRGLGFLLMLVGIIAAVALGIGMHELMAPK